MNIPVEYPAIGDYMKAIDAARLYCFSEMGKTDQNSEALEYLLTLCNLFEGVEDTFVEIDRVILTLESELEYLLEGNQ